MMVMVVSAEIRACASPAQTYRGDSFLFDSSWWNQRTKNMSEWLCFLSGDTWAALGSVQLSDQLIWPWWCTTKFAVRSLSNCELAKASRGAAATYTHTHTHAGLASARCLVRRFC